METNPFSLAGRTALVTGGATGLGFAISKCLSRAGATVVAAGTRTPEQAAGDLAGLGPGVAYRRFDVTDAGGARDFVAGVGEEFGTVTILVNNAGVHCKKPIEEMTPEDFSRVLEVHLVGAFALTRAAVPAMKAKGGGSVIFQASLTSFIGQPFIAGYSAAKAGILGLVHTLASELGASGIRVNAIAPGWIETPMFHQATDNDAPRLAKILGRIPMKKTGRPDDVGMAAVFLAGEAAKYINGVCLPVDGGALIGF
ncbi:MAG: SDR family oxidoreductase [Planctomycetota bacterium]|nr:SDR family oxidoreductase [Planctomycetota bacterium]